MRQNGVSIYGHPYTETVGENLSCSVDRLHTNRFALFIHIYFTTPGHYIFSSCIESNQLHQSGIFYEPKPYLGQNFKSKLEWTSCQLLFVQCARIESTLNYIRAVSRMHDYRFYVSLLCVFRTILNLDLCRVHFFFCSNGGHK